MLQVFVLIFMEQRQVLSVQTHMPRLFMFVSNRKSFGAGLS